jgi:endonuclease/exonuclease/phosphatase family metal-dependent hydrolase
MGFRRLICEQRLKKDARKRFYLFPFLSSTMNIFFAFLFCLLASSTLGQTVRLMTYNIRLDYSGDGINQWPNRKTKVFDLIRRYDPDIFGVQEATPSQMEDFASALTEYKSIGVGRDDGKNKGEFSAIFYKGEKFGLLDQNTFWLSETPEVPGSKNWDAAITRIATWGKFRERKSSKEFVLLNTHFDHIGKEARMHSAELIKKSKPFSMSLPLILMGDFNCTRQEPPYSIMISSAPGVPLFDAFDAAPESAPGTYCGFEVNGIPCKAIDYIFYSAGWKMKKFKVIRDNNGKYYPSDHLPVMVKLKGLKN